MQNMNSGAHNLKKQLKKEFGRNSLKKSFAPQGQKMRNLNAAVKPAKPASTRPISQPSQPSQPARPSQPAQPAQTSQPVALISRRLDSDP